MSEKPLTPTMIDAMELAVEHGGKLVRFQGGFWAAKNSLRDHNGNPYPYHGTTTIQGLVARGYATYTDYQQGRRGGFPIEMTLTNKRNEGP